ncbi:hypothetical protein PVAP13_6NG036183 [Panicum virgatum]|uniref:Uncharacterized protein n=1 Tax=Panicum virgatum TaxID=38727 RepID=A0A8T0QUN9_PANVG|nr:hypothetical protein PVAP13_6NG036183 [Panicum virgatum]
MAATTPAISGEEFSITVVEPTAQAAGDEEVPLRESRELQQRRRESSADMVRRKLERLNQIVFCVAFLEWAGNAVGTLAFIWATVILLGGFSSLLSTTDFWFCTVMIFMDASRVFIRNDASVNQWLFGSTRAFRWENLSFPRMFVPPKYGNVIAVIIGVGISLTPLEFHPQIAASILKVILLVVISQLLARLRQGWFAYITLFLLLAAAIAKRSHVVSNLKFTGLLLAWVFGTFLLAVVAAWIMSRIPFMRKPVPLLCFRVAIASGLACLPFLQAELASYYKYFSISVAAVLLTLSNHEIWGRDDIFSETSSEENSSSPEATWEQNNSSSCALLLQILETVLPILFFWSVMFPLPGIPLKIAFYMLFSVIAAVLIANLQIPVAFLQVLLSALRLCSLLGHHHHDYRPLPPDASPNLVPSIVIFFMMELCQGSSYILAIICGLISLLCRRSLVRDLEFRQDWGPKAVNLYHHQVYQARTERGLFPSEKHTPSLTSFAIESLGNTSSEMQQLVGLHVLHNFLERWDSESKNKLITEIIHGSKNAVPNLIDMLGSTTVARYQEYQAASRYNHQRDHGESEIQQKMMVYDSALKFVRRLAIKGGKIGMRFRHELSENYFFLNSLERILDLEDRQPELWEPVMDIIAKLALDKAARQEIGSTHSILRKLVHGFLRPDDVTYLSRNNDPSSLQMIAGETLANLTIMSVDNCWAILWAEPGRHNLIEMITSILENECCICVAATLLHNLCANSRDKLIDLGANAHLESALTKVMQIIRTSEEGKQLEAALCVASQIGYVIPEYFTQVLESCTDAAATELVEKLVDTLSNREPSLEYPRIRRVLVEVVISIVDLSPGYIKIFREKGAKDALDIVKGTPSRLEKYMVFLDGEGVVAESLPMRDLVDKAKRLIYQATPTRGAQPVDHP